MQRGTGCRGRGEALHQPPRDRRREQRVAGADQAHRGHQVLRRDVLEQSDVFGFVLDVYRAPMAAVLVLAGLVIAVAGALIPARGAARTPIAAVLRSE
ncbi:hypothetical protein GCM10017786_46330 [Amycolatopsis deserti]|uniref:Uncharacterized protein n=1 Tax=Amycolatopsis deserti TaxID=185696 RepID=A0ABQ3J7H0_9PSEU|nr:hypothetical protein GCM10017786_46330 [Amycolatopsis deserti]